MGLIVTSFFALFAYDCGLSWYWLILLAGALLFFLVNAVNKTIAIIERFKHQRKERPATVIEELEAPQPAAPVEAQTFSKEKKLDESDPEAKVDFSRDLYVNVRVTFNNTSSENQIEFAIEIFNGSLTPISFSREIQGFMLLDDKPLPDRPQMTISLSETSEQRLTVLTVQQPLEPAAAISLKESLDRGERLTFLFSDLRIFFTAKNERENHRLTFPYGVGCQKGICTYRHYNIEIHDVAHSHTVTQSKM